MEEVVDEKYGVQWGRWCSEVVAGSYGMEVWKFIRGGWDLFSQLYYIWGWKFSRICFWNDQWCDDMLMKDAYSKLFYVNADRNATVPNLSRLLFWVCYADT